MNSLASSQPTNSYTKAFIQPIKTKKFTSSLQQTTEQLNQAILQQNYASIKQLLTVYPSLVGHDKTLYKYAQGMLWRSQYKYAAAIKLYQKILAAQPELDYVRLSLAKMQLENKAYQDSKQNIQRVLAVEELVQPAKQEANYYLALIKRQTEGKFRLNIGLQWGDNVNNASSSEFFYYYFTYPDRDGIWAALIPRDKDDGAKRDIGPKASLSYSKSINVKANHYLYANASLDGEKYFRYSDAGVQALTADTGYRWQNYNSALSLGGSFSKVWEAGSPYYNSTGISAEYYKWLTKPWKISLGYDYNNKKYADAHYIGYEGNSNSFTLSSMYYLNQAFLYGGVNYQRDKLKSDEQSANKYMIYLGAGYVFANQISLQANLRKSYKNFDAPYRAHLDTLRRDREIQFGISISPQSWQLYGFTPELSISRTENKSSIYLVENKKTTVSLIFSKVF